MFETHGIVRVNEFIGGEAYWMEIKAPDFAACVLPGQFVMVKCGEGYDPLTGRPFSVADTNGDRFGMGYIVVGKGTGRLSRMEPGTEVPLVGPLGNPFKYREPADAHMMIAGGIGSAPFPLLARALAAEQPDAARVVLLGGRTHEHLYLRDRFIELGCDFRAATDDGSEGHHGFVTDLLDPFLGAPGTRMYACGPTPMFKAINRRLEGCDTPCEVSVEPIMACGFGACYGCVVPVRDGDDWTWVKSCEKGPTFEIRDLVVDQMEGH